MGKGGVREAAALPIAHSVYATFDDWLAAIREVADETFLDLGWRDGGDSMLDVVPFADE
jgi:hypothetical protein